VRLVKVELVRETRADRLEGDALARLLLDAVGVESEERAPGAREALYKGRDDDG
jgi:hypothetical protein